MRFCVCVHAFREMYTGWIYILTNEEKTYTQLLKQYTVKSRQNLPHISG